MIQTGNPAAIYRAWQEGQFVLLICAEQFDELRATLRKPAIAERIKPYQAGGLVNAMKKLPRAWARCRASAALPIPPTIFCWRCPKRAGPII